MSQAQVLCPHCGRPHDLHEQLCPWTGKALRAGSSPPAQPAHLDMALFPLIGQTLGGKYLVRTALGKGGMGTVYEGVNLQIGRVVALKVLHAKQLHKQESVKRFYQEARTAGAIGHPNICEVFDLGTLENGCPYLVMERLVGVTLAQRIAAERILPIDDVLNAMTQVLSGLVAAHAKGILHRDIKPENVFLTQREGYPPIAKLLDFGVSKILPMSEAVRDSDLDLTHAGMVMGTPFYMSPEQARGDRDLDARLDIYGCGVVLYEALTGVKPFYAKSYNVLLWQILTRPPKPARELRPEISPAIASVIERAMARIRDDRFPSAMAFIQALAQARSEPHMEHSPYTRRVEPAPETQRMDFAPGALEDAVFELSSDSLVTRSSSEVAVRVPDFDPTPRDPRPGSAPPPTLHQAHRRTGFEDIPTVIERAPTFSLADEGDAATTLMKDDELAELARSAMRSLRRPKVTPDPPSTPRSPSPPPSNRIPSTRPPSKGHTSAARAPLPAIAKTPEELFPGDETVKMDNPLPRSKGPKPRG